MWGPGQTPDPAATGTSPAFQPLPMVKTVFSSHTVLLAIPEGRPDLRTKKREGRALLTRALQSHCRPRSSRVYKKFPGLGDTQVKCP